MIKQILTFFTDTIFRKNPGDYRNPLVRWSVRQYKLLFYTARGLLEHDTIVRSAALTFYTLMSIVPIVAVIFAVMKGFGLAEGVIEDLYGIFPRQPEIVDYLVEFADKALARTQGGVVAVVALLAWLRRRALRRRTVTAGPTWGCGFTAPNVRMQYTGESFSEGLQSIATSLTQNSGEGRAL